MGAVDPPMDVRAELARGRTCHDGRLVHRAVTVLRRVGAHRSGAPTTRCSADEMRVRDGLTGS
ncbi:hypothetical protein IFM12275_00510 [Nocardia sputorum]|nr:hypothetical protein IFM12275_00510 [Nocardia sputorum]